MAAEILEIKKGPSTKMIKELFVKAKHPTVEFTVFYRDRELNLSVRLNHNFISPYFKLKSDIILLDVSVLYKEFAHHGISLDDKDVSHSHAGLGMLGKYYTSQGRGYFVLE